LKDAPSYHAAARAVIPKAAAAAISETLAVSGPPLRY